MKIPTYSTNQGLSKNAIKKVAILIGSKDMVFAKSLWRTGQGVFGISAAGVAIPSVVIDGSIDKGLD